MDVTNVHKDAFWNLNGTQWLTLTYLDDNCVNGNKFWDFLITSYITTVMQKAYKYSLLQQNFLSSSKNMYQYNADETDCRTRRRSVI
jgi:hypothetical protein